MISSLALPEKVSDAARLDPDNQGWNNLDCGPIRFHAKLELASLQQVLDSQDFNFLSFTAKSVERCSESSSSAVTKKLALHLNSLENKMRDAFVRQWKQQLPKYWCHSGIDFDIKSKERRDMLVSWARVKWHRFLDMKAVQRDMGMPAGCFREIMQGRLSKHKCGSGFGCDRFWRRYREKKMRR
jgi:hypothetical protein